jgi:hypothetical protein
MALGNTCLLLEGRRFQLRELELDGGRRQINKINIRQTGHTFSTRLFDKLRPRRPRAIQGASG